MKFYICKHCGNIIAFAEDKGVPVVCCGEKMSELVPGSVDAAQEKHVPVIEVNGNLVTVTVGSVEHPMLEEVDGKPEATFALTDGDEVVAAYEYCNLHGLWKAEA